MNVISIDPSLRSLGAYRVLDGESHGFTLTSNPKIDRLDVLSLYTKQFLKIARGYTLLIIEDYPYKIKNSKSVIDQAEVGGLIRGIFAACGVPIIKVPIQTWKSIAGVRGDKKTKEQKERYIEQVKRLYGKEFFTTDECDAYLMYYTVKKILETRLPISKSAEEIKKKLIGYGILAI